MHQLDEQPVRSTMQTGPKGSFRNDQLQTGNELGAALKTAGAGPDSTFSEATTAVMPGHNTKRVGPDHQASGREKVAGASSFATGKRLADCEVPCHAMLSDRSVISYNLSRPWGSIRGRWMPHCAVQKSTSSCWQAQSEGV